MGTNALDPTCDLAHYEGLITTTASRLLGAGVEMEFDDIAQMLRIKVWRALDSFDPSRSRMPRQNYVFMCLRDQAKDLGKRKRYGTRSLDGLLGEGEQLRDRFEAQHGLSVSHDEAFSVVEDDSCAVPNTLTAVERDVVLWLYRDYRQSEVARQLGLDKREMERLMRSIRQKLADWRPTVEAPRAQLAA